MAQESGPAAAGFRGLTRRVLCGLVRCDGGSGPMDKMGRGVVTWAGADGRAVPELVRVWAAGGPG